MILIKNGTVFDGKGSRPEKKDILIDKDTIVAVEENINPGDKTIYDATGLSVTPGFVDIHRHCDSRPILDDSFGEIEALQGITTVCAGNCGLSSVPYSNKSGKTYLDLLSPCLGELDDRGVFSSYSNYVAKLEDSTPSLNFGFLIGLGAVKCAVKGLDNSPFTADEMKKAQDLVCSGFENGALGISIGIMYPPECYSSKKEFESLIKIAKEYDGVLCTHIRGEGDSLIESVSEVIEFAKNTGVRLNISHFKATGKRNWNSKIKEASLLIDKARLSGIDVSCDFYPYEGGSSTLQSLIPLDLLRQSTEETADYLCSKEGQLALSNEIVKQIPSWDNMVESIGWDRIVIGSAESRKEVEGLDFTSASKALKMTECELLARLYKENNGRVGITVMSMDSRDVDYVASLPYSSVISDALYGSGAFPHPRLYGAFPRFLRRYTVESNKLTRENAIYKMTYLPAYKARILDRGAIAVGMKADINVFDWEKFKDNATFSSPKRTAEGLTYSFVNGALVVENGKYLKKKSGSVIKRRDYV